MASAKKDPAKITCEEFAATSPEGQARITAYLDGKSKAGKKVEDIGALLTNWSLLADWIRDERSLRIWLQDLEPEVDRWSDAIDSGSRSDADALVLRGPLLTKAVEWQRWAGDRGLPLTPDQQAFVGASVALQKREARRRTAAIGFAGVVAVLVLAGAVSLGWQWLDMRFARERASGPVAEFPPGAVLLGNAPGHLVDVGAFALDKHEVSVGQYRECQWKGQCTLPSEGTRTVNPGDPDKDLPVTHVTALQADQFCHWIGRRLPTYAEWERAVRGDTYRQYPWGNTEPFPVAGEPYANTVVHGDESGNDPPYAPVGGTGYRGTTPDTGIVHLVGNVAEWTTTPSDADVYQAPRWDPDTSPRNESLQVVGLSLGDQVQPDLVFASARWNADTSGPYVGFRCAS